MSTTLTHPSAQSALRSTARQDGVAAVLGLWMIGGLYADGWAHLNVGGLDSFFTPWHGVLYSGFTATAGWLAWTIWSSRRRSPGGGWRAWLPQPYRLGALSVIVFGLAGVADMLWHLAFGIETKGGRPGQPDTSGPADRRDPAADQSAARSAATPQRPARITGTGVAGDRVDGRGGDPGRVLPQLPGRVHATAGDHRAHHDPRGSPRAPGRRTAGIGRPGRLPAVHVDAGRATSVAAPARAASGWNGHRDHRTGRAAGRRADRVPVRHRRRARGGRGRGRRHRAVVLDASQRATRHTARHRDRGSAADLAGPTARP